MKIILRQYVRGLGEKGDILDISDGYAQNALIPKGLAKAATKTEINKIKQAKQTEEKKAEKLKEKTLKVLDEISGKTVIIKEKLNEKGSLYHALGLKDIIRAVHDQLGINTPNSIYADKYALKEAGEYILKLEAYEKTSSFYLIISSIK